jgi:hypothetical protein
MGYELDFPQRVLLTFICSMVGFIASYLVHFRESEHAKALTREFYALMHRPVDFAKEIGEDNDYDQMHLLGTLSLVVCMLMLVLLVVPNSVQARLTILYMGGGVGAIGALLLWAAARRRRQDASKNVR